MKVKTKKLLKLCEEYLNFLDKNHATFEIRIDTYRKVPYEVRDKAIKLFKNRLKFNETDDIISSFLKMHSGKVAEDYINEDLVFTIVYSKKEGGENNES